MSSPRDNRQQARLPPHSSVLHDIVDDATSEQILKFLTNAAAGLVRTPNCPCLYCTGQSDNAFLILEEAWNARAARARVSSSVAYTAPRSIPARPHILFGYDSTSSQLPPAQVSLFNGPGRQGNRALGTVSGRPDTHRSGTTSEARVHHAIVTRVAPSAQGSFARPAQPPQGPITTSVMPLLGMGPITFHQAQGGQLTFQGMAVRAEPGMLPRGPTSARNARAKADLGPEAQLAILAQCIRERQSRPGTPVPPSRRCLRSGSRGGGVTDRPGSIAGSDAGSSQNDDVQTQTGPVRKGSLGLGRGNWARGRGNGGGEGRRGRGQGPNNAGQGASGAQQGANGTEAVQPQQKYLNPQAQTFAPGQGLPSVFQTTPIGYAPIQPPLRSMQQITGTGSNNIPSVYPNLVLNTTSRIDDTFSLGPVALGSEPGPRLPLQMTTAYVWTDVQGRKWIKNFGDEWTKAP